MAEFKRRKKLIKPQLQLRLTMIFVGLSALALIMQFTLFMSIMSQLSLKLPHDGAILMEEMNRSLIYVLGMSLLMIAPLTFLVGIMTTFRIAGPVYRVEMYLRELARGEYSGPCTLRRGDKLKGLVALLNEAVDTMRSQDAQGEEEGDSESWEHKRREFGDVHDAAEKAS